MCSQEHIELHVLPKNILNLEHKCTKKNPHLLKNVINENVSLKNPKLQNKS